MLLVHIQTRALCLPAFKHKCIPGAALPIAKYLLPNRTLLKCFQVVPDSHINHILALFSQKVDQNQKKDKSEASSNIAQNALKCSLVIFSYILAHFSQKEGKICEGQNLSHNLCLEDRLIKLFKMATADI